MRTILMSQKSPFAVSATNRALPIKIFSALAEANIDVDMIVQSASATDHKNDILFTVTQTDMVEAMSVIESLKETMHFDKADIEVNVAKVSIVGAGMLGSPRYCRRYVRCACQSQRQYRRYQYFRNQRFLPGAGKGR